MDTLITNPMLIEELESKNSDVRIELGLKDRLNKLQNLQFKNDVPWYFIASEHKETKDASLEIDLGFKIHVPIHWSHPNFLETVDNVINICDSNNKNGHPTGFKIVKPTQEFYLQTRVPKDKGVVIYPNLLKEETDYNLVVNFVETCRIGDQLGRHLIKISDYETMNVSSDVKLNSGVFVRYGALHKNLIRNDNHHRNFWDNLAHLQMSVDRKLNLISLLGAKGVKAPVDWEHIGDLV